MKNRILVLSLVMLLALSLVAVGCPRPVEVVPPVVEVPKPGGELTILQAASADNLDPIHSTLFATYFVISLILDELVALDQNLQPVPHLAESWKVSEDELTWTFQIRKGIRFHDGTPLNAEAVAFTLNRFAAEARLKWMLAAVEEVVVIDEYVVEVRLRDPAPLLLYMLAKDWTGIVSPTAVEKYGDDFGIKAMVGTGPFILQEFVPGDKVLLVRNEDYTWGPPYVENRGPAHLERITFRVIPEEMTRVMEFEVGRGMAIRAIPHIDVPRFRADPDIQMAEIPVAGADYLAFNVTRWPFDDVRIRQAFIHAINVEPLIEIVLGGLAERAYSIVAPGQVGYWKGIREFAAPFLAHDPERALQLFAEAGWLPGPDRVLVHQETGTRAAFEWWRTIVPGAEFDATEVKIEQLREIGVEIELLAMEGGTLGARRGEGVHDIFQWGYGWPYACGALHFFYHTDNVGTTNANHLSDQKMDALIHTARTALDPEVRFNAIAEAKRYAIEMALMAPLWHELIFYAVTGDVGGFDLYAAQERPYGGWSRNSLALDLFIRGG
ncbi:MAG: Glutathione-binding protein GsiB [Syntrophomonadaceae bacterium]|nr:Glutathione-binding protein GsiB [Bacillota bacterium]MBT9147696.1 Glutathione-binding protein GsiB [Bacillota bacterium]